MEYEYSPTRSIIEQGYSLERIQTLSRLGLLFDGVIESTVDGQVTYGSTFTFVPDSPLGRANRMAGSDDLELLSGCIDDAHTLAYGEFVDKYPSLAPFHPVDGPRQQG